MANNTPVDGVGPVDANGIPYVHPTTSGPAGPDDVNIAEVGGIAIGSSIPVTTPGSTTAGSPSNTAVTSTSGSVLAANVARRECTIVNTDVVVLYLGLGQVPTATAYHIALSPCTVAHDATGGTWTSDIWKGAVNCITASTGGHCVVTELT